MTKFKTILSVALAVMFFGGCSEFDDDTIEDQREDIVTYLTTSHSPALIAQEDLASTLDEDPAFYSTSGYTTYCYISNYYDSERESRQTVQSGSVIYITFSVYDFSSFTTPTQSNLYYTNDPDNQEYLNSTGLNTEYWSFEPQKITIGNGDILKAVETALVGCKEGDNIELYLTYNMGYGNQWVGTSDLEEPLALYCTIDTIEN